MSSGHTSAANFDEVLASRFSGAARLDMLHRFLKRKDDAALDALIIECKQQVLVDLDWKMSAELQ